MCQHYTSYCLSASSHLLTCLHNSQNLEELAHRTWLHSAWKLSLLCLTLNMVASSHTTEPTLLLHSHGKVGTSFTGLLDLGVLPKLHLLGKARSCVDQAIHNARHSEHPSDDGTCCCDEMVPAEQCTGQRKGRQSQTACRHLHPRLIPATHHVILSSPFSVKICISMTAL